MLLRNSIQGVHVYGRMEMESSTFCKWSTQCKDRVDSWISVHWLLCLNITYNNNVSFMQLHVRWSSNLHRRHIQEKTQNRKSCGQNAKESWTVEQCTQYGIHAGGGHMQFAVNYPSICFVSFFHIRESSTYRSIQSNIEKFPHTYIIFMKIRGWRVRVHTKSV